MPWRFRTCSASARWASRWGRVRPGFAPAVRAFTRVRKAREMAAAPDAPIAIQVAAAGGGAGRRDVVFLQVGEQVGQVFPGAGAQCPPGPLLELVGGDPARLEGL